MKSIKLALLASIVFISCEKNTDDNTEESPIVGTWNVVNYESRIGNGDWSFIGEDCRLDDVEEYESNGRWAFYDGTNQCEAGTGIMAGTWKLKASNTKIVYTYDGYSGEYESTVEELTENSLILSWSTGDINNTQYRTTYKKK